MMSNRYGEAEDKALDRTLKIAMAMESMRHSDLRYESNVFALQQAKEKSARERESYTRMPSFMADLNTAINDPEKSPYERDEAVSKVAMNYPHLLAVNPAAGKMYAGAAGATSTQIRGMEYQTRQENKEFADASGYADPALQEEALGGGKFGERGRRALQDQKYRTKKYKEAQEEKDTDKDIALNKERLKIIGGIYEDALDTEHDVSPEDAMEVWRADPANQGKGDEVPSFAPRFSQAKEVGIREMARSLGLPDKDLTLPIDQLHMKVIQVAAKEKRSLETNLGYGIDRGPKTKAGSGFTR